MSAIIIRDIEQGSDAWHRLRAGIPTSSCFDKIVTPGKLEVSKSQDDYLMKLHAEWISGRPADTYTSGWMERGKDVESEARAFYEFDVGAPVEQVAFVYSDDRRLIGCSPDALVGDDGGLELKCPSPHVHLGYLLKGVLPNDYRAQVYGSMLVTGRQWWDFLSYCPGMPEFKLRVERDMDVIIPMAGIIERFVQKLLEGREQLQARGLYPREFRETLNPEAFQPED